MAEATNGNRISALSDSVGRDLTYKAAVVFVTLIALPFGLWIGNRLVTSMDAMAQAIQSMNERLVRLETRIEFIQRPAQ